MRLMLIFVIAVVLAAFTNGVSYTQENYACPIGGYTTVGCPVRTDSVIKGTILSRISGQMSAPPNNICVDVQDGVVTLTGQVDTRERIQYINVLVSSVCGVTGVCNNIVLVPLGFSDVEITQAVKLALGRVSYINNTINVRVNKGVVQLTGMATSEFAKTQAEIIAMNVPGVTAVHNNVIVDDVAGVY